MKRAAVSVIAVLLGTGVMSAQDLEPKAYVASPIGAAFLIVGATRSTGDVLTDPTLPLADINAKINGGMLATGYTFGLFDRITFVSVTMPYLWGDVSGQVAESARSVSRSGLGDARIKVSINLVGNPAMRPREFARAPRRTIIGASLMVAAPTGQYYGDKLINLGTNRWAFKPEIGVSVPKGPWDFDAYFGVWLFTANDNFFPGSLARTQDVVAALQGHASYAFQPRLWVAVDATWYAGGAAQVTGQQPQTPMNNSRLGATMALPVTRTQSLKLAYSSGLLVRTGTNFRTFSIGWQWLRLTKL